MRFCYAVSGRTFDRDLTYIVFDSPFPLKAVGWYEVYFGFLWPPLFTSDGNNIASTTSSPNLSTYKISQGDIPQSDKS